MRLNDLPNEIDDRLWEWAHFFRDRKSLETCRSIEKRFKAASDDFGPSGWGDMEAAPENRAKRLYALRRAIETHDVIQTLDRKYKWALTYGYCYPNLPRHLILRFMKKYTGIRFTWTKFLDEMDIARMRVYSQTLTKIVW